MSNEQTPIVLTTDDLITETMMLMLPVEMPEGVAFDAKHIKEQHLARIAELEKQYSGIAVKDVHDKDEVQTLQTAITEVTKMATSIKQLAKDHTKPWYDAKKAVDDYARELEDTLRTKVLNPLSDEKQRVKEAHDAIAREEEERKKAVIADWIKEAENLGMVRVGHFYEHRERPDIRISKAEVEGLDDAAFRTALEAVGVAICAHNNLKTAAFRANTLKGTGAVLDPVTKVWSLEGVAVSDAALAGMSVEDWESTRQSFYDAQAAVEERERKAKEEREQAIEQQAQAVRKQQEENDRRSQELAAKEAAMNARVNESRKQELQIIGCDVIEPRVGIGARGTELFSLYIPDLHKFTDEQWAEQVLAAKLAMEDRNLWLEEKKAEEARQAIINEREEKLKAAGWEVDGNGRFLLRTSHDTLLYDAMVAVMDNVFPEVIERGHKELARRKEAEAEAIRQQERERIAAEEEQRKKVDAMHKALMGDMELWEDWIVQFKKLAPTMATERGKFSVSRLLKHVDELTDGLRKSGDLTKYNA